MGNTIEKTVATLVFTAVKAIDLYTNPFGPDVISPSVADAIDWIKRDCENFEFSEIQGEPTESGFWQVVVDGVALKYTGGGYKTTDEGILLHHFFNVIEF